MANRVVAVALKAEVSQYVAGMSKAALSTSALGQSSDDMARRTKGSFDIVGKASQYAGLAVAGALIGVISKASEFEAAMSRVDAATHATASTMEDLRQTAIDFGASTQYSATEAADGITELAKAGLSAADITGGALAGALSLAAAGQLDVADAAEIAATQMTVFNLAGNQTSHVADLLAAGAGKAQGSVQDMALALSYAGQPAAGLGISIEETTGALAYFASTGLIGERAGTALRGSLVALTKPTAQTKTLMDELGLSFFDAQGEFIGLDGVAGELQSRLGDLTTEQRNAALAQIFGNEALGAAQALYSGGSEAIQEWTRNVDESGYAAETAARLQDNLRGDLEKLSGAFDTLLINLGSGAQGPLRMLTQGLTGVVDVIGSVVEMVGSIPGPVMNASIALAGIYVAAGPLKDLFPMIALNARVAFATIQAQAALSGGAVGLMTAGLGAARTAIAGLLTTLAPFAVVAVAVGAISRLIEVSNAADEAREEIGKLTKAFDEGRGPDRYRAVAGALDQVQDAASTAQDRLDELNSMSAWDAFWSWDHAGDIDIATDQLDAAQDALDGLDAAAGRADQSIDVLSRRYNMSRSDVEEFADAHGIDLSGSLQIVQGDFMRVADAAGYTATGIAGVSGAAGTGYENLITYAAALGLSDDATEELRKHTDELGQGLSGFADPLSTYTGLIDTKKQAEQESAQATADATEDQSDSWEDYVSDVSLSVDEYLLQLEEQIAAQDNWQANMLTLAGRVSQGTIDELARMGPEGAPLVAQLVNASDSELARLETVFGQRSANAASQFGEELLLAQPVLSAIAATAGDEVVAALAQQLAAGTTTVAAIAAQYGIVLADGVNPVLTSLGRQAIIPAAPRTVPGSALSGRHADGGYISGPGSGTSDSIPAMLSNGEFVIRAASVDKYGVGLLSNINEGRALFAKGGFVSGSDVPRPSSTAPFRSPLSTGADAAMQAGYDAAVAFMGANAEAAFSGAAGPAGSGGIGGGWQAIAKIVQSAIPQARINSTYRPGDPGYHGRGKAVDFGFGSGPGGAGSAGLAKIASFLYSGYGSTLAELIYDGIGDNTPDVKNGRPHTYNAATRAQHANHVHAAVYDQGGLLPSGTAALNLSGSPELVLNPAQTAAAMRSREFSGTSGVFAASSTTDARSYPLTVSAGPSAAEIARAVRDAQRDQEFLHA